MKIEQVIYRIIVLGGLYILILFVTSCSSTGRLPAVEEVGTYPFGSEIDVLLDNRQRVKGELIAVERNAVLILNHQTDSCMSISPSRVRKYAVYFARPKNYAPFIPLSLLLSIAHGYYAAFTLPLNIITTFSVTMAGTTAYQYSEKELEYKDLHMFARFPQGLPSGLKLEEIR